MYHALIAMIALLLLAACTTAPPGHPNSASVAGSDAVEAGSSQVASASHGRSHADEEELICRNERVIGSRLPQRVCGTQRQWDAMREGSRETTRDIQRRPTGIVEEGG